MEKVYYDIASITNSGGNACAVALIVQDEREITSAGTTIYSMSVREKNDEYRRYADKYDLNFIFDDYIPAADFYAVPMVDIFAFDSKGGLFGTVGDTTGLGSEAPVCYINKERKCFLLAVNLKEFIDDLNRKGYIEAEAKPYDEIRFYPSLSEAKACLNFIEIDLPSFDAQGVSVMRKEKEMLRFITETAQKDSRIRAAYLEGSRANAEAPRDIFQDYDIVYIVDDTQPFIEDKSWIDRFGTRLYMQYPEESVYYSGNTEKSYGWLMQLADGNRLDLHVCTKDAALSSLELYRVLVDKDGVMPKKLEDSDEIYWVRRPSQVQFACTCNEFWWCLNNVAKGLWRDELPYVMDMLDFHVRPMLRRILEWRIGAERDFNLSVGKSAKYMKRYLERGIYERYLSTYPRADCEEIWRAVIAMCELFDEVANGVAKRLDLVYDLKEADAAFSYLKHVRTLPPDATEVY